MVSPLVQGVVQRKYLPNAAVSCAARFLTEPSAAWTQTGNGLHWKAPSPSGDWPLMTRTNNRPYGTPWRMVPRAPTTHTFDAEVPQMPRRICSVPLSILNQLLPS
jgi:hypothetical protein